MDTVETVLVRKLIIKDCYMASLDLRDACYYMVLIAFEENIYKPLLTGNLWPNKIQ